MDTEYCPECHKMVMFESSVDVQGIYNRCPDCYTKTIKRGPTIKLKNFIDELNKLYEHYGDINVNAIDFWVDVIENPKDDEYLLSISPPDLSSLDEKSMNKLGWFRYDANKKEAND